jgi:hypothetical protein
MFGKAHVCGSSASYPGDISSDDASDEDEDMVSKPVENIEKIRNIGKRKHKGASTGAEEKDEKSPFFHLYKSIQGGLSRWALFHGQNEVIF